MSELELAGALKEQRKYWMMVCDEEGKRFKKHSQKQKLVIAKQKDMIKMLKRKISKLEKA